MKMNINIVSGIKKVGVGLSGALLASQVYATDKLAGAMQGDVQDMLGGSGTFWKVFILIDIILSAAALIKTKNPLVMAGVFFIAFIPALLINTFVF